MTVHFKNISKTTEVIIKYENMLPIAICTTGVLYSLLISNWHGSFHTFKIDFMHSYQSSALSELSLVSRRPNGAGLCFSGPTGETWSVSKKTTPSVSISSPSEPNQPAMRICGLSTIPLGLCSMWNQRTEDWNTAANIQFYNKYGNMSLQTNDCWLMKKKKEIHFYTSVVCQHVHVFWSETNPLDVPLYKSL